MGYNSIHFSNNTVFLVTGGAGFIGSHTVVELLNDTWYPIDESNLVPNDFNSDTQFLSGTHVIKDNDK